MGADDWGSLVQVFGPLAAVLLVGIWLFISGKIHGDKEFQREVRRGDKFEDMVFQLLPATRDATEIAKKATAPRFEKLDELVDQIKDIVDHQPREPRQ